jgi:hypothetical protein
LQKIDQKMSKVVKKLSKMVQQLQKGAKKGAIFFFQNWQKILKRVKEVAEGEGDL